ncbi:MAG: HEAT repeat domain-containing protein [Kangiellaceae bacterium]|jgi:serine/threonine-protein phosphatase 2A regulatory subunit A|nr:HEAT repeat domain-containing protein [Kangiellaceae bacterium]
MAAAEVESVLALIDELRSEDRNAKLHAITNLSKIGEAIGSERTKEELVPFVVELIEDTDSEILLALARATSGLSDFLRPTDVSCLLEPLMALAGNEETVVREEAIKSVKGIVPRLSEAD